MPPSGPGSWAAVSGTRYSSPASRLISKAYCPGTGQGEVEDQHRPRLDVGHPRRRLAELHGAFAFDQFGPLLVHEPDPHRVLPDLGAPAAHPEHQMRARMHGRELWHPDVLEQPQHGELALLVDQGVVGENREIEEQGQATRMEVITSFFRMAFTTSMPWSPGRRRCAPCRDAAAANGR